MDGLFIAGINALIAVGFGGALWYKIGRLEMKTQMLCERVSLLDKRINHIEYDEISKIRDRLS